jgi:hypothetical protein
MCRNHHHLLEMAVIESLPLRQTVWTAENSCLSFPQNYRITPIFGDLCSTSRTAENGLLRKGPTLFALFLRRVDKQSDLQAPVERTVGDHKMCSLRTRFDFRLL